MLTCEKVSNMFSEYLDNQLTEIELINFQKHIDRCMKCREELFLLQKIVYSCKQIEDQELPEDFSQKLHLRLLQTKQAQNKKNPPWYLNWKMYSGIAAGLLIITMFRTQVFDFVMRPEKAYVSETQLNQKVNENYESFNHIENAEKSLPSEQEFKDTGDEKVNQDNEIKNQNNDIKIETNNGISKEKENRKTEQEEIFSGKNEKSQEVREANSGTIADTNSVAEVQPSYIAESESKESELIAFKSTESDSAKSDSVVSQPSDLEKIPPESNKENVEMFMYRRSEPNSNSSESSSDNYSVFAAKSFMASEKPKISYITKITVTKQDMEFLVGKLKEIILAYDDKIKSIDHGIELRLTSDEYITVMNYINSLQTDIEAETEMIDKEEEYNRLIEQRDSIQQKMDMIMQDMESADKSVEDNRYEIQLRNLESELAAIEDKITQIIQLMNESILIIYQGDF